MVYLSGAAMHAVVEARMRALDVDEAELADFLDMPASRIASWLSSQGRLNSMSAGVLVSTAMHGWAMLPSVVAAATERARPPEQRSAYGDGLGMDCEYWRVRSRCVRNIAAAFFDGDEFAAARIGGACARELAGLLKSTHAQGAWSAPAGMHALALEESICPWALYTWLRAQLGRLSRAQAEVLTAALGRWLDTSARSAAAEDGASACEARVIDLEAAEAADDSAAAEDGAPSREACAINLETLAEAADDSAAAEAGASAREAACEAHTIDVDQAEAAGAAQGTLCVVKPAPRLGEGRLMRARPTPSQPTRARGCSAKRGAGVWLERGAVAPSVAAPVGRVVAAAAGGGIAETVASSSLALVPLACARQQPRPRPQVTYPGMRAVLRGTLTANSLQRDLFSFLAAERARLGPRPPNYPADHSLSCAHLAPLPGGACARAEDGNGWQVGVSETYSRLHRMRPVWRALCEGGAQVGDTVVLLLPDDDGAPVMSAPATGVATAGALTDGAQAHGAPRPLSATTSLVARAPPSAPSPPSPGEFFHLGTFYITWERGLTVDVSRRLCAPGASAGAAAMGARKRKQPAPTTVAAAPSARKRKRKRVAAPSAARAPLAAAQPSSCALVAGQPRDRARAAKPTRATKPRAAARPHHRPAPSPPAPPPSAAGAMLRAAFVVAASHNQTWRLAHLVDILAANDEAARGHGSGAAAALAVCAMLDASAAAGEPSALDAAVFACSTEATLLLAAHVVAAEASATAASRDAPPPAGGCSGLRARALGCAHARTARALLIAAYGHEPSAVPLGEWPELSISVYAAGELGWRMSDLSEGAEPVPVAVCNELDDTPLPRFAYVCEPVVGADKLARRRWGNAEHRLRPTHCRLEVFRTRRCGWGVRALERIARHAHVCVYAGALVDTETAEARTRRSALNDAYIFDVSRTPKGGYAIDGFAQRGVGSFINFSCAPNLRAAAFRTQSGMTLIAFKASRDIEAYEELSYSRDPHNVRAEQIDDPLEPGDASPRDADEGIPALNNSCACGAARCLGRF